MRQIVNTVATVNGQASVFGEHHPKSRVWLLENRTAVLCTPGADGRSIVRQTWPVTAALWQEQAKVLTVELPDGTLQMDARGCGCGMGAVGNAGPVEGQYDTVRVRPPDWYQVST